MVLRASRPGYRRAASRTSGPSFAAFRGDRVHRVDGVRARRGPPTASAPRGRRRAPPRGASPCARAGRPRSCARRTAEPAADRAAYAGRRRPATRASTCDARGARRSQLAAQLAEQPEALGDDVVLVDRLEVLLARRDERAVRRVAEALDDAARSSRARSPRRSAGGGAPSRRRRPRRSASSARRSPTTSSPRRSPAASRASISSSQSSGQPMCSVPRPRWLCVATGTASKMRSISSSAKPSAASRSRARAGDELLRARACGHALRGDADQPARAASRTRPPSRSSV